MDFRHAFYLATVGGAKSLGLQDRIGNLQAGMEFDAFILSNSVEQSVVQVFDEDSVGDVLQKLLVLGDDRNVKRVFVRGRDVTVK
jgi:guanine deaminase